MEVEGGGTSRIATLPEGRFDAFRAYFRLRDAGISLLLRVPVFGCRVGRESQEALRG